MNLELYKILQFLANGRYHSGEDLAKYFNTSRAAISKRVAKLNKYLEQFTAGFYSINTVVGKGYCLNNAFDYISGFEIENKLKLSNLAINNQIVTKFLPVINSTSDFLSDRTYSISLDEYHLCIAEQQLNGRGRNTVGKQKNWHSPFGNNIYCSIAWQYPGNKNALIGLSLVAGITVAELLYGYGCQDIGLKWPNDILVANRKIAGILTESYGDASGCCRLVIGFGINIYNNYNKISNKINSTSIAKPWTNLVSEYGNVSISRNQLIADLIVKFLTNYEMFIENGLTIFLHKWSRYDKLINKMINIDIAGNIEHGKYLGIDEQGALLADINGKTKSFYSGEVSVSTAE